VTFYNKAKRFYKGANLCDFVLVKDGRHFRQLVYLQ
jgi:hypothetical protein